MKKIIHLFGIFVVTTILVFNLGCDNKESNSNKVLASKQENLMQEANRQVGMPNIVNFQERKLLKMIIELRDQENLVCYAYIVAEMTGKLVYVGKCIGYGIPYATQFTNPQKEVYAGGYNSGFGNLPQADPNGLFMPDNAEGTWVMLIDPKTNEPHPVYIEPRIIVSPFKLNVE